jgi:nicotinate-nucleotide adenylyltransferase
MRIVFGGAFNPVTKAHIDIVEFLKKEYPTSKFTFLPVSSAYTKRSLASDYHRLNMLNLAIDGYEDVDVSTLEMSDTDFLGTYQSLIRLSDLYEEDIYFVMGADNLNHVDKWINASGLLSEFKFIVLGRDDINITDVFQNHHLLQRFKENFIVYDDFKVDISSTAFRTSFDQSYVLEAVYEYIIENNLYRGEEDAV